MKASRVDYANGLARHPGGDVLHRVAIEDAVVLLVHVAQVRRERHVLQHARRMVSTSLFSNNSCLETAAAPAACAFSRVRFWLQATHSMPKALPIAATRAPMLPSPSTPRVFPASENPGARPSCHRPARMLRSPWASPLAAEMIRPHVSSTVESPPPAERVLLTGMPRSFSAWVSRLGERAPVRLTNFRLGSFSISARPNAVRSRIRQTASNDFSFCTASSLDRKGS